ncbi:hypothetical protein L9F63_007996, partial [Diploptera punctata]
FLPFKLIYFLVLKEHLRNVKKGEVDKLNEGSSKTGLKRIVSDTEICCSSTKPNRSIRRIS